MALLSGGAQGRIGEGALLGVVLLSVGAQEILCFNTLFHLWRL